MLPSLLAGAAVVVAAQSAPLPQTQIPGLPDHPETAEPLPDPIGETPDGAVLEVEANASATPIGGIRFIGEEAPEPVAMAAQAFLGRPASLKVLQELAKAISAAYAETGIALYTVAIPTQDLSQGTVRVQLAEGHVSSVRYGEDATPLVRAYAGRLEQEDPLTRRSLERYVSLIRDIPGMEADVDFKRGKGAGGVELVVEPDRKRSEFAFGINNMGTKGLGRGQLSASARLYSLLRDGDGTVLSLAGSTDLDRYRQATLSHSTPIGSDGLRLGLYGAYVRTVLRDPQVEGDAYAAGLSLSYPVIRGYRKNLRVSFAFDGINSDAALLGSVLVSDRTRSARLGAAYSNVGKRGVFVADARLSKGLDILGAETILGLSEPSFLRGEMTLKYDRVIGKQFVGRARLGGQYTRDRLPGNERFVVGGLDYGRAFRTNSVSGDSGVGGSLELAWRPDVGDRFTGSEVYAFTDGAYVHRERRGAIPGGGTELASAGGGVRFALKPYASLDLEGTRAIHQPEGDAGEKWRFNLRYTLRIR